MTFPERHLIPRFDVVIHDEDYGCPCGPERSMNVIAGKHTLVFYHCAADENLSRAWGMDLPTVLVHNRVQR